MQSSMWSNSSTAVTQYQQQPSHQQQQQLQPHDSQHENLSALHGDVCPHLKVMRRGVDMAQVSSRQPQQAAQVWSPQPLPPPLSPSPQPLPPPPQFTSRATGLAPSGSSSAMAAKEEDTTSGPDTSVDAADANRFPLLSLTNSLRQTSLTAQPAAAIPLVSRQQRYLQQHRQQLLLQHQQLPPSELSSGPAAEAALRLKLQRKRIRYRALILIYLSCMLLFVLAVVFLAALGVFYTAGSTAAKAQEPVARIAPSEQAATASIGKGASP